MEKTTRSNAIVELHTTTIAIVKEQTHKYANHSAHTFHSVPYFLVSLASSARCSHSSLVFLCSFVVGVSLHRISSKFCWLHQKWLNIFPDSETNRKKYWAQKKNDNEESGENLCPDVYIERRARLPAQMCWLTFTKYVTSFCFGRLGYAIKNCVMNLRMADMQSCFSYTRLSEASLFICNDRIWMGTYRVRLLKGKEMSGKLTSIAVHHNNIKGTQEKPCIRHCLHNCRTYSYKTVTKNQSGWSRVKMSFEYSNYTILLCVCVAINSMETIRNRKITKGDFHFFPRPFR